MGSAVQTTNIGKWENVIKNHEVNVTTIRGDHNITMKYVRYAF